MVALTLYKSSGVSFFLNLTLTATSAVPISPPPTTRIGEKDLSIRILWSLPVILEKSSVGVDIQNCRWAKKFSRAFAI